MNQQNELFTKERIRRIRGKLTQVQFAMYVGVQPTTVARWEAEAHQPSPMAQIELLKIERDQK